MTPQFGAWRLGAPRRAVAAATTAALLFGLAPAALARPLAPPGPPPGGATATAPSSTPPGTPSKPACDLDNGGIQLPAGFCATVFADGLRNARQMAVAPDGTVYLAINDASDGSGGGGIAAMRDDDGDGHADRVERFGTVGGNGIAVANGWLYFAPNDGVVRYKLTTGQLVPSGEPERIVSGLPANGDHVAKTVVVQGDKMFVNIGSATNACQVANRVLHSPGIDPCPELAVRSGVWQFSASRASQTATDGTRMATGTRNMVALAVEPTTGDLYGVQNGRDQLAENWPELYTPQEDRVLPAEEVLRLEGGQDYGWPYCYKDPAKDLMVLAPEYGGDGNSTARCADKARSALDLPAHWAPLSMLFPTASVTPSAYRDGAFVASHGSRFEPANQPEGPGYNVVFLPFRDGQPTGERLPFADGFAGDLSNLPATAAHRPVGLAQGADGALYISDDVGGRVWRVVSTTDGSGGPTTPATPADPTPDMARVLEAIRSFDAPPLSSLPPTAARNLPGVPDWVAAAAAAAGVSTAPEPVGDISHVTIDGGDERLLARVYTPAGTASTNALRPVVVYFHGGGWVVATLSSYDASARAIANASGAIVVSVAYRQAPEHPFPAPMDDAWASYLWVLDHAAQFGGDPSNVAVAGESAGGNLATVVAMRARDEGVQLPTHQLLIYPVTNYGFETTSYQTYANAIPLDFSSMQYFWHNYLLDAVTDGANVYASPLRSANLAGLPPATVILAEIDPLQSEGTAYAQRLAADGVPTTWCLFRGVTHEFFGMGNLLAEAKAAQQAAGAGLRGEPVADPACRTLTTPTAA